MKWILSIFVFLNWLSISSSQNELLKCGHFDPVREIQRLEKLGDHWGYGYKDLLDDLQQWEASPWVEVQSIGNSVEGRPLWELTITDPGIGTEGKHTIYMHTRTHPGEVQSTWVTNELIKFLLSDYYEAEILRSTCVFYMLPMYNPDGVELEYPRENANHIDMESNWFASIMEPEVLALQNRFMELMNSPGKISLALNMHSAYACKRYFVYHHENGTSYEFTELEKKFIRAVKNWYEEGIEPWDYYISWTNGTPMKYPESWWWLTHGEEVLALTYEDMNCDSAGNFDKTAIAILRGIANYFSIDLTNSSDLGYSGPDPLFTCYPNPIMNNLLHISYDLETASLVNIRLLDTKGQLIQEVQSDHSSPGSYELTMYLPDMPDDLYYCRLIRDKSVQTRKIIVMNR